MQLGRTWCCWLSLASIGIALEPAREAMDCKETEASLSDSKVCTESSHSIDTVILLAKGGCTQATPDPEFSRQLDHLDAPNISTYYISPIEFTFVNQDLLRSFLARPNDWSGLILTSKRCVDAVVLCLAEMAMRTILLSEWSQLKIFTVGEATSTYLFEQCQLGSIGHHSGNATSLGEFILQSFSSTQSCKPLLYPCSNIRSDFITDLLRDNVVVQELICYETLANQQIDRDISLFTNFLSDSFQNIGENMKIKLIVVFFSPSGVEHLLPLLRDNILTNSVFTDRLSLHFVAFGKTTASKMTDLNIDVWFISSAKIKSLAVDIINHLKGTSQINVPIDC